MLHQVVGRKQLPELRILIPVASTIPNKMIEDIVGESKVEAQVVDGQAIEVVRASVALCARAFR